MLTSLTFATPAAATVLIRSTEVDAYTLTFARLWATAAALLGLAAVIVGGVALWRSARGVGDNGRRGAVVAQVAGAVSVVVGALNLAVATGGPGTGNGVIGGAAAIGFGLVAVVLGALTVVRARRRG